MLRGIGVRDLRIRQRPAARPDQPRPRRSRTVSQAEHGASPERRGRLTSCTGPTISTAPGSSISSEYARAMEQGVQTGLPFLLWAQAENEGWAGNWPRAEHLAAEGYSLAEDSGSPGAIAFMSAARGLLHAYRGRIDAGQHDAARAVELARELGMPLLADHGGSGLRDRGPVDGRRPRCPRAGSARSRRPRSPPASGTGAVPLPSRRDRSAHAAGRTWPGRGPARPLRGPVGPAGPGVGHACRLPVPGTAARRPRRPRRRRGSTGRWAYGATAPRDAFRGSTDASCRRGGSPAGTAQARRPWRSSRPRW